MGHRQGFKRNDSEKGRKKMNNEQRERLVEILNKIRGEEVALADYEADVLIDHLIENNVVVLPCKVGDVVYRIGYSVCHRGEDLPDSCMCSGCEDECDMKKIVTSRKVPSLTFIVENFIDHNNYYLTREEAEKALKRSKQ